MLALIYFYAVWVLAGFVTGLTSFGSNLIAVPLLSFVYSARDSILIGCLSAALIFLALSVIYYRAIIWRETICLVAGALAGIPPGAWFLQKAGSAMLLLAAGLAIVLFLIWQYCAARLHRSQTPIGRWFAWPMGLASGLLMGGVGMGGPPLVLYIFLRHYDKKAGISSLNAASVGIMLCLLPWQYCSGMFPPEILKLGFLGGLAGLAGILASAPLLKKVNIALFRRLLLVMLALSAFALLLRGAMAVTSG